MALLLAGLNHRTAPLALRERLYVHSEMLGGVMTQLHRHSAHIDELAIISTCNRFEVYAATNDGLAAQQDVVDYLCEYFAISEPELYPGLYIQDGEAVVNHVMSVACGLDSMVLGEAQILGQVNAALEIASTAKTTGAHLHRLFEAAIHAGKRARTETKISRHTTSISHAAAMLMRQKLSGNDPDVLILGAGEMAQLAVLAIHKFGLSHIGVINRTHSKAQALATKFGAKAYAWSKLEERVLAADVLIAATGAPYAILHADFIRRIMSKRPGHQLMLIDIAVPRDIAPDVANVEGVSLYDVDSLQHIVDNSLAAREACVPQVNAIVEQESARFMQWLRERVVVPVIKTLRSEVATIVEDELNQAINKMPDISEAELEVVKRMAHRIMNKLLHAPTANLRAHASENDATAYAAMVQELFALDNQPDDYRSA